MWLGRNRVSAVEAGQIRIVGVVEGGGRNRD